MPLGKIVLASRVQSGFAFGRDPLSYSDRFRAGGGTSVRGYGEESLGPRVAGIPSGGDRLLILNQEVRFPMFKWAGGVVFVDAGNIFCQASELRESCESENLKGLRVGYGFGLRLNTPVGLLRGDVGFPRTELATAPKNMRFYFGFGHIF